MLEHTAIVLGQILSFDHYNNHSIPAQGGISLDPQMCSPYNGLDEIEVLDTIIQGAN